MADSSTYRTHPYGYVPCLVYTCYSRTPRGSTTTHTSVLAYNSSRMSQFLILHSLVNCNTDKVNPSLFRIAWLEAPREMCSQGKRRRPEKPTLIALDLMGLPPSQYWYMFFGVHRRHTFSVVMHPFGSEARTLTILLFPRKRDNILRRTLRHPDAQSHGLGIENK